MTDIVHYMGRGLTACGTPAVAGHNPVSWPEGHKWDSDWKNVTCEDCLLGKDFILTYRLDFAVQSITCKRCGLTSYNKHDFEGHYCGNCKVYHDDLWPPARRSWIMEGLRKRLSASADQLEDYYNNL